MFGRPRIRAAVVEDCRTLDVRDLIKPGAAIALRSRYLIRARLEPLGLEAMPLLVTLLHPRPHELLAILEYEGAQGESVHLEVPLAGTPQHFLGLRWWLCCPVV